MRSVFLVVLVFFITMTNLYGQSTRRTGSDQVNAYDVSYVYSYPGDKIFKYGIKYGEWYALNTQNNKTFIISRNPKYRSTVDKLDALYPGARVDDRHDPDHVMLEFIYHYPGDKTYIYAVANGEWYAQNTRNNNIFNISRNPKYRSTIRKLDQLYPQARW